ncbi:MAG: S8 family serine peptidase, partial [Burkholderiaceae bacterium]
AAEKMIQGGADVSVNSWGLSAFPFILRGHQAETHAVGRDMAEFGRGGLGIVTLFAAGNEREMNFDTNDTPITNMPWAIGVAASDQKGGVTIYSNAGASVLVTAPGSFLASIVTTDLQGELGRNTEPGVAGNYTDRDEMFIGTSASTPIAGGVVALMLEANPGLGYRDVQEILVYSSRRATFLDRDHDHAFNGAHDWNGGALLASHDFGYGHIDAFAAVRLAESWMKVGTVANLLLQHGDVGQHSLTVDAGQQATATASFAVDYRLEQMMVNVSLEAEDLKYVTVELISPDGMVSRLINQPPSVEDVVKASGGDNGDDDDDEDDDDDFDEAELSYSLNSVLHWGAGLVGEWTLRLSSLAEGKPVHLKEWSILAHTTGGIARHGVQIFTDEFARFADLQPERGLIDAAHGLTLNAAAVTQGLRFDLSGGESWIGETAVSLIDPGSFRHLVSGDGDDVLIGNGADNILMAGRGNNHMDGGGGMDVVRLIGEFSNYTVERHEDGMTLYSHSLSGGGVDVLYNIELLHFADQVVLARPPTDLATDLFDEAGYLGQNPDVAAAVAVGQLGSGFEHYASWGATESRNPNVLFHEIWYLNNNADVAQAVINRDLNSGYQHYQIYGWQEGRSPSAWMDTTAYLQANTDVAAAQLDPLQHYLQYGFDEGRIITALGVDMWG